MAKKIIILVLLLFSIVPSAFAGVLFFSWPCPSGSHNGFGWAVISYNVEGQPSHLTASGCNGAFYDGPFPSLSVRPGSGLNDVTGTNAYINTSYTHAAFSEDTPNTIYARPWHVAMYNAYGTEVCRVTGTSDTTTIVSCGIDSGSPPSVAMTGQSGCSSCEIEHLFANSDEQNSFEALPDSVRKQILKALGDNYASDSEGTRIFVDSILRQMPASVFQLLKQSGGAPEAFPSRASGEPSQVKGQLLYRVVLDGKFYEVSIPKHSSAPEVFNLYDSSGNLLMGSSAPGFLSLLKLKSGVYTLSLQFDDGLESTVLTIK